MMDRIGGRARGVEGVWLVGGFKAKSPEEPHPQAAPKAVYFQP